jgi:hypothetical protein
LSPQLDEKIEVVSLFQISQKQEIDDLMHQLVVALLEDTSSDNIAEFVYFPSILFLLLTNNSITDFTIII